MNDQVENVENENETTNTDFPEIYTKAEAMEDQEAFMAALNAAQEELAEDRQFNQFTDINDVPEGFSIVIDQRDKASFKDNKAAFLYAMPTYEAIAAQGEKGLEFIKDCVESAIQRKASAYCAGVNRSKVFRMPTDLNAWLVAAQPKSSGTRALSKKSWTAVSTAMVNAINSKYSAAGSQRRITKSELTNCMSNASFAAETHDSIKNWDNIFVTAKNLITKHVQNKLAEASEMEDKEAGAAEAKKWVLEKELAILDRWAENRDKKEELAEVVIEDLDIDFDSE